MSVSWDWVHRMVADLCHLENKHKYQSENVTICRIDTATPVIRIDIKLEPKGGDSK